MSLFNLNQRFRGFLPVVVDVETGGLDPDKHALLEICAIFIYLDHQCHYRASETLHFNIKAHPKTEIVPKALEINGIKPGHPFRAEVEEAQALKQTFTYIRKHIKKHHCSRAVLVGHNAPFDLAFIQKAAARNSIKRTPFHSFSTIDTVSLSALLYGETVLSKALAKAGIEFDENHAHSALYDTEKTAELFCHILNHTPFFPLRSS
ncbi:ribonuclease T [Thiotrichales bacterium 19S3-7]|nr:ribonuclease T [Thiotrichales bacterium 19S3-7]MCF6801558.1 ribonuclease T [Thiotrichales bacterium 19S3-11]